MVPDGSIMLEDIPERAEGFQNILERFKTLYFVLNILERLILTIYRATWLYQVV